MVEPADLRRISRSGGARSTSRPRSPTSCGPLLVWKAAFETTNGDGRGCFGDRYALVRLEDLRRDPAAELERVYALIGRELPDAVVRWAAANIRGDASIHLGDDPRWGRAARLLGLEEELEAAGYGEILELDDGRATRPRPAAGALAALGDHRPGAAARSRRPRR